ncbi:MAG TPA: FAD-linked oxidase C-terminal domain-containing protein [Candidatus Binataceae bacterium]|nr:FAD-linked oxidase C-terminal domain-containing protein [Candidatus Binataceae bacterium]
MSFPLKLLEAELRRSIEGDVRFDRGSLVVYSTDASNYRQIPLGVVVPRHEGDVIRAVALARENSIPLLARGGGTSLGGQTVNAALVLDFSKYMNSIGCFDAERRTVAVEPGVVQTQLNRALAAHDLFFPPDPTTADRCTIGGMVGNNACGAHSAAYGKTVDNLHALEVLLYDGTRLELAAMDEPQLAAAIAAGGRAGELYARLLAIRDRFGDLVRSRYPKIPRRVSGYNLDWLLPENGFNPARALAGSEGTLAIILKATLEVVPKPKSIVLAVLGFEDIFIAADQVPWILEHRPEALEGFDSRLGDFARARGMPAVKLLPDGRAFLAVELGGNEADDARGRGEALVAIARRRGDCSGAVVLTETHEQQGVWGLRGSGLGASAFVAGYPRTWPGAEDTAVPPARLGAYLRRLAALLERQNLRAASFYGHFGEGCVHCRINFDLASAPGIAVFRATMEELAELVAEFGGSLSGEHGDGRARSELLPKIFGPTMGEAFGEFKRAFDPDQRMNPGVIVKPYALDSNLRLGPSFRAQPVATHFDFTAEGGLGGAAMRCVGIGKCRKVEGGTMCPSYMATREEIHSTRGRARILFEALSGDALPGGFGDAALKEALDLCLSCKACKTECPSGVDMAAYKSEFFSAYYRDHRRPLNSRFFGAIHELGRIGALAPRSSNAIIASAAMRSTARRWLGIDPERSLPRIANPTFRAWFRNRAARASQGREVMLFADTFNNFFEPEVAIAAVAVLERAGFDVLVPGEDLCCGRPLYDQGMLARAKRRLRRTIDVLGPHVRRGVPIVGLEPSCILTFRDELPGLFPNDNDARALAAGTQTFAEFIADRAPAVRPAGAIRNAILHGHCHQKALAGLDHEIAILRRQPDLKLAVPDSGCCGMAGAFGYDAAHREISRAIGERVILRAVREGPSDTIVIADGFACRTQIRQFCPGRNPLHLAQVLDSSSAA